MRLRKNMKRTAAAVLALSMAVSAVAAPASAAYICDVSQGNVEVSVDTEVSTSPPAAVRLPSLSSSWMVSVPLP